METTLLMRGGTPRATIPFIKKMGFVADNGTPTDRYKEFRNDAKSGATIAAAMRELYLQLFQMNESVYEIPDGELRGLVVELTGSELDSQVTKLTVSTFNALRELADFDAETETADDSESVNDTGSMSAVPTNHQSNAEFRGAVHDESPREVVNLSYTINLNLPATADIDVFNAIFKSLKENILDR